MKKQLLMKTFLAAAIMCAGTSVKADDITSMDLIDGYYYPNGNTSADAYVLKTTYDFDSYSVDDLTAMGCSSTTAAWPAGFTSEGDNPSRYNFALNTGSVSNKPSGLYYKGSADNTNVYYYVGKGMMVDNTPSVRVNDGNKHTVAVMYYYQGNSSSNPKISELSLQTQIVQGTTAISLANMNGDAPCLYTKLEVYVPAKWEYNIDANLTSGQKIEMSKFSMTLGGSEYNTWATNKSKYLVGKFTPNTVVNPTNDETGRSTLITDFTKESTLPVEGIYFVFDDIEENGKLSLTGYSGGTSNVFAIDATNPTLSVLDIFKQSIGGSERTNEFNVQRGHRYYFFQIANSTTTEGYRYSLKSVTFTPSNTDSYTFAASGSPLAMTSDLPGVDGVVMEFGTQATSTNYWEISDKKIIKLTGEYNGSTYVYNNITRGSDGFYLVFKPYKSGMLAVNAGDKNFYGTTQIIKVGDESHPLWSEEVTGDTKGSNITSSVPLVAGETYYFESNHAWTRLGGFTFTSSVPVSISKYGWATYSSDYALDFTSVTGLEAYMITGHVGNAITKTQVTGTVPAGTGLLLKGAAGDYDIPVVASSTTDDSANLMKAGTGASVSEEGGKTKYVLGVNNNGTPDVDSDDFAEFQKIVGTPATVDKGKAYLEFAEEISVKSLSFIDDGKATGVETVQGEGFMVNDEYYNLNGQQVTKDYKGIVIKNGKKYFNK